MLTQTIVTPDPASSVEITQNAKGFPQVTIKVYHTNPEAAAQEALALYRRLTRALEDGAPLAPAEAAWETP
jgi:hypothetical protein